MRLFCKKPSVCETCGCYFEPYPPNYGEFENYCKLHRGEQLVKKLKENKFQKWVSLHRQELQARYDKEEKEFWDEQYKTGCLWQPGLGGMKTFP